MLNVGFGQNLEKDEDQFSKVCYRRCPPKRSKDVSGNWKITELSFYFERHTSTLSVFKSAFLGLGRVTKYDNLSYTFF